MKAFLKNFEKVHGSAQDTARPMMMLLVTIEKTRRLVAGPLDLYPRHRFLLTKYLLRLVVSIE